MLMSIPARTVQGYNSDAVNIGKFRMSVESWPSELHQILRWVPFGPLRSILEQDVCPYLLKSV